MNIRDRLAYLRQKFRPTIVRVRFVKNSHGRFRRTMHALAPAIFHSWIRKRIP